MGLRSRLRGLSSSGRRSPSPQPPSQTSSQPPPPSPAPPPAPTYSPLLANLPETIVLNLNHSAATISILTQAVDAKPVFQIDYSSSIFVTHIPTSKPVGSVTFGTNNHLTINQPGTNTSITYKDTLTPPPWFKSMHGNELYWSIPACNQWQATLQCEIVDGVEHPNDEDDIAVEVILDSKLKKGRIEIRKQMSKEEMDLLLLSALAEIEDLKGKLKARFA
ncbi:hypothetical protein BKA65DRAFT_509875 [Rhexocercosporidium sp. MPI-PUGE-AT-0058]|nr:hypothetical protein BKA65DRAFT_509875 [Rhexocercosporidium sp. MPI-PUGE-AT-0058]